MYSIEKSQFPYFLEQFQSPQFEWTNLVSLPYYALWRVMKKQNPRKVYYVQKKYETVCSISYGYLKY